MPQINKTKQIKIKIKEESPNVYKGNNPTKQN